MKQITLILCTTLLLFNCSGDDDSNDIENDPMIEDGLVDNEEPTEDNTADEVVQDDALEEENEAFPFLGRWTLIDILPESIQGPTCDGFEFISFDENGNFLERKVATTGITNVSSIQPIYDGICRVNAINERAYEYNEVDNEITFTEINGDINIASVSQDQDQLILTYNEGSTIITYERESEENEILETEPLWGRWFLTDTAGADLSFESISESDCGSRTPSIIFGVRGIYFFRLSDRNVDPEFFDICNRNSTHGEYTYDDSTITIKDSSDIDAGPTSFSYTLSDDLLIIDRFGDGTLFERYLRE